MEYRNQMSITMPSLSINEGFARSAVAAFCVELNPTLDEIADIKTAVSEAVTNCVVHAYPDRVGNITLWVGLTNQSVIIKISDKGVGIEDLDKARQPFFSTKPTEERAGMGFTVMESFMDEVILERNLDRGITVTLQKNIQSKKNEACA